MKKIFAYIMTLVMIMSLCTPLVGVQAAGAITAEIYPDSSLVALETTPTITIEGGTIGEGSVANVTDGIIGDLETEAFVPFLGISTADSESSFEETPVEMVIDFGKDVTFSGVRIYQHYWRPWVASGMVNIQPYYAVTGAALSVYDSVTESWYPMDTQYFNFHDRYSDVLATKYGKSINVTTSKVKVVINKASGNPVRPEEIAILAPTSEDAVSTAFEASLQTILKDNAKTFANTLLENASVLCAEIDAVEDAYVSREAIAEMVMTAVSDTTTVTEMNYSALDEAFAGEVLAEIITGAEDASVVTVTENGLKADGIGYALVENGGEYEIINVVASPIAFVLISGQSNSAGAESDYRQTPSAVGEYEDRFLITNTYDGSFETFGGEISMRDAIYSARNGGRSQFFPPYPYQGGVHPTSIRSVGFGSTLAMKLTDLWDMPVWVLNAGKSGHIIELFDPENDDTSAYDSTVRYSQAVLSLIEESDHYYLDDTKSGLFWLQGCSNGINGSSPLEMAEYTEKFERMYNGFKTEIGLNYANIILVRAAMRDNPDYDFYMSGPRLSQIYMGNDNTTFSDVNLIMDTNIWQNDEMVDAYFSEKYPDADAFKAQWGYDRPSTHFEIKPTIHYHSPGYNEIGLVVGDNVANIESGNVATNEAALYVYEGTEAESFTLDLIDNPRELAVPMSKDITYNASLGLTVEVEDENVATYDDETFEIVGLMPGETKANLMYGDTVLASYDVAVTGSVNKDFYYAGLDADNEAILATDSISFPYSGERTPVSFALKDKADVTFTMDASVAGRVTVTRANLMTTYDFYKEIPESGVLTKTFVVTFDDESTEEYIVNFKSDWYGIENAYSNQVAITYAADEVKITDYENFRVRTESVMSKEVVLQPVNAFLHGGETSGWTYSSESGISPDGRGNYIDVDFGRTAAISGLRYTLYNTGNYYQTIKVLGSNDFVTWTDAASGTGTASTTEFKFGYNVSYRYYRIIIDSSWNFAQAKRLAFIKAESTPLSVETSDFASIHWPDNETFEKRTDGSILFDGKLDTQATLSVSWAGSDRMEFKLADSFDTPYSGVRLSYGQWALDNNYKGRATNVRAYVSEDGIHWYEVATKLTNNDTAGYQDVAFLDEEGNSLSLNEKYLRFAAWRINASTPYGTQSGYNWRIGEVDLLSAVDGAVDLKDVTALSKEQEADLDYYNYSYIDEYGTVMSYTFDGALADTGTLAAAKKGVKQVFDGNVTGSYNILGWVGYAQNGYDTSTFMFTHPIAVGGIRVYPRTDVNTHNPKNVEITGIFADGTEKLLKSGTFTFSTTDTAAQSVTFGPGGYELKGLKLRLVDAQGQDEDLCNFMELDILKAEPVSYTFSYAGAGTSGPAGATSLTLMNKAGKAVKEVKVGTTVIDFDTTATTTSEIVISDMEMDKVFLSLDKDATEATITVTYEDDTSENYTFEVVASWVKASDVTPIGTTPTYESDEVVVTDYEDFAVRTDAGNGAHPIQAFTRTPNGKELWVTDITDGSAHHYVDVDFGESVKTGGFRFASYNKGHYMAVAEVFGSNDFATWTRLGGETASGTYSQSEQEITFDGVANYRYYRVHFQSYYHFAKFNELRFVKPSAYNFATATTNGGNTLTLVNKDGKAVSKVEIGTTEIPFDTESTDTTSIVFTAANMDTVFSVLPYNAETVTFTVTYSDDTTKDYTIAVNAPWVGASDVTGIEIDPVYEEDEVDIMDYAAFKVRTEGINGKHPIQSFTRSQDTYGGENYLYMSNIGDETHYIDVDFGEAVVTSGFRYELYNLAHNNHLVKVLGSNDYATWTLLAEKEEDVNEVANAFQQELSYADNAEYRYYRIYIESEFSFIKLNEMRFMAERSFEEPEEEKINVNIKPVGGSVQIGGNDVSGDHEANKGEDIVITATPDDNNTFKYWLEVNTGKILSEEEVLTLGGSVSVNVSAIFVEATKRLVTFYNHKGDNVLGMDSNVEVGEAPDEVPTVKTYRTGYTFLGWNTMANANKVLAELTTTDDNFYAVYNRDLSNTYAVTVENGECLTLGYSQDKIAYAALVTVKANGEGTFLYWTVDGEIASYDEEFTFNMPAKDIALVAVYGDAEVEEEVTISLICTDEGVLDADANANVAGIIATRYIPVGVTVKETGILYVRDADIADLTLESVGQKTEINEKTVKVALSNNKATGQQKLEAKYFTDLGFKAVAFVTYVKDGKVETTYSNVGTIAAK